MKERFSGSENVTSGIILSFCFVIVAVSGLLMNEVVSLYGDTKCKLLTSLFILGFEIFNVSSAIYHFSKKENIKKLFRKTGISAFFLSIITSFLPISLITIGKIKGIVAISIIGALALTGMIMNLINPRTKKKYSFLLIVISELVIFVFANDIMNGTTVYTYLMFLLSSLLIIIAVIFYGKKAPFSHAVFHGFLLVATTLQCLMTLLEVIACAYMNV